MKVGLELASAVAMLGLFSVSLHGGAVPSYGSQSIPKLFADASLVFKGEIIAVSQVPGNEHDAKIPFRIFEATARVERRYKGGAPSGDVIIRFTRPEETTCNVSHCESLSDGEYGLFFLSGPSDRYQLLDPHWGKFAVSRLNGEPSQGGLEQLEDDLVAGLQDREHSRVLKNIELFGSLERVRSTKPLLQLLPTSDLSSSAAIYAALLRLRDYSQLSATAALMEIPSRDPFVQTVHNSISGQILMIRDRQTVPLLMKFARSRSDLLREGSIHALREMGDPAAVPTFVAALDDPVRWIRYDAVYALATIEGRPDLSASLDELRRSESKYVKAWKLWWAEEGKQKYE